MLAQATATAVPGSTVPCADVAGQTCTVTGTGTVGSVTGSGTITPTGAESWTLTASVPTGFLGAPPIQPGTIPPASFTTITGTQTLQCATVTIVAGGAQTTCTGTTTSPGVQGSTVTVTFVPGATATGLVSGPGPASAGPGNPPASSGTPNTPCAGVVGGTCTINGGGGVTGIWTRTSSGTFSVVAIGPTNTAPGSIPQIFLPTTSGVETFACPAVGPTAPFTTTCAGTTVGNLLAGATATVRFPLVGGGTTDVTGIVVGNFATVTPTPGTSLTTQQALALVAASGQTGVPCAITPGDTCQVTGAVNGTGRVTSSMLWNVTATVPAGVGAGIVPVAVFSTTSGLEAITCARVLAGVATVTCTGTTTGNALQRSTVTVVSAVGIIDTGTVTGPGIATIFPPPLPLLPPPLAILPPPPPPLLPPPPSAPMGMTIAAPMGGGRFADVPVVPEADSVLLVLGGLAALGLFAGLRARRRTDP